MEEPVVDEYPEPEADWGAFYFQEKNEVLILTGLIHEFLGLGFEFDIPVGRLYGGFYILGHEMVHGFDDVGRTRDKDGRQFNWWKPLEVKEYEESSLKSLH